MPTYVEASRRPLHMQRALSPLHPKFLTTYPAELADTIEISFVLLDIFSTYILALKMFAMNV